MNVVSPNAQPVRPQGSAPMTPMTTVPATAISPASVKRAILAVAGPAVAIVTAWLCSLPKESDSNGFTMANVALLIAVVTIGFALLESTAGVITSIAAALSLNYFHTAPYRTLRVNDRRDLYSVLLLGAIGLVTSSITELRVRRNLRSAQHQLADQSGLELADFLSETRPAVAVWNAAIAGASGDLALVRAEVTKTDPRDLPIVRRRYVEGDDPMFGLPTSGATVKLTSQTTGQESWIVITPKAGFGPLEIDRRVVMAFIDTVELGLRPMPSRRSE